MKSFSKKTRDFYLDYESGDSSVGLPSGFIFYGNNAMDEEFDLILSIDEVRQLAQLFSAAVAAYDAPETGGDKSANEPIELCSHCKVNPASEPHVCPYAEDVHNVESLCDCCHKCTYECAMDI
jgi:hypothetical protein